MTAACCFGEKLVRKGGEMEKEGETNEEEDLRRIEERDHHGREGLLGDGIMDREGV